MWRLGMRGLIGMGLAVATAGAQGAGTPRIPAVAQWSLSAAPTLTIGTEGDSSSEFTRIVGLLRTRDGAIHVNDFQSPLRIFGPDGKFRRSYARRGSGPGEAQFIFWFGESRDTLLLFDPGNARITRFRTDGTLIRTTPIPGALEQSTGMEGRTADGAWIAFLVPSMTGFERSTGVVRPPTSVAAFPPSLEGRPRILTTIPWDAMLHVPMGKGSTAAQPPFGASHVVAIGRNTVWIGDNATDSIRSFDPATGRIVATAHTPWPEVQVTRSMLNSERERRLARNISKEAKAITAAVFAGDNAPKTLPRYGGALVDADDHLWVSAYALPTDASVSWWIHDAAGRPIASIALPRRFRLFQAGRDWVLGSFSDDDNVETVQLYRLEKR